MEIYFAKQYLKELYCTGKSSEKQHRYQPDIIKRYRKVIEMMISAADITDIAKINSLRYEKLRGDKSGISSVRVNDKYRVEFEEMIESGQRFVTMCNIVELSKHYKK